MAVVDPSLNGNFHEESVMSVLSLAVSCVDPETTKRPTMGQVVRALTEAAEQEIRSNHFDRADGDGSLATLQSEDSNEDLEAPINFSVLEVSQASTKGSRASSLPVR